MISFEILMNIGIYGWKGKKRIDSKRNMLCECFPAIGSVEGLALGRSASHTLALKLGHATGTYLYGYQSEDDETHKDSVAFGTT